MNDSDNNGATPRYRWPWFALAAVVIGVALFFFWVGLEALRVRDMRESKPSPPMEQGSQIPSDADDASVTNQLLAGYEDLLSGGNTEAGRKIFFQRPEASCAQCHSVGGAGGNTGPALDGIGSQRTRSFILEALLYPNLHVNTNYETVILILKNGRGVFGRLRGEDAATVTVQSDDGLIAVSKDEIQTRQKGVSPMPAGLGQILSRQDLRDLVEFVASLKK